MPADDRATPPRNHLKSTWNQGGYGQKIRDAKINEFGDNCSGNQRNLGNVGF